MFGPQDHMFALCAYKESPYLEECLTSLLEQAERSQIVISTSTPNAHIASVAHRYQVNLVEHEGPSGIARDWLRALSCCEAPLVTIAHQDDVYLPAYRSTMLACMNEEERPLIFFSDYGELRGTVAQDESRLLAVKRLMLRPLTPRPLRRSRFLRRRVLSLGSPICCPAVTYCLPNLPQPVFLDTMKCDLDWQAWERFSKLEGSFVYSDKLLMRHRIHEESETSALIQDNTRSREDLEMFQKFWPAPIARVLNRVYSGSQASNALDA